MLLKLRQQFQQRLKRLLLLLDGSFVRVDVSPQLVRLRRKRLVQFVETHEHRGALFAQTVVKRHQFVDVESLELDRVGLDVNRYDPVTQILDENHVEISADGVRFGPIRQRLTYPAEFDLMARIARLRLRERWGGWNGEEFTAASTRHVSVYEAA